MGNKRRNTEPRGLSPKIWLKSIILFALVLAALLVPLFAGEFSTIIVKPWFQMLVSTLVMCLVVSICTKLTDIFCLRRKESGITWCQIAILIVIGLWIIGMLVVFDIKKDSRYFLALGIVGTMLSWIFQETLKGVVAFLHVRLNHLLSIDDWIQVPKFNVDGEVKRITLTTVTVYNWDTTISSIPTSVLHSDHFVNFQKMSDGKTYGRQMEKAFIIDTRLIHSISAEEVRRLKAQDELRLFLPEEEIKEGVLNAQLFRTYVFHWMMANPNVSQQPRLLVRWLQQEEAGLPLQLQAFLMESGVMAFEWQQSQIIEHIVQALDWFGLRLYQSPSSYDIDRSIEQLGVHDIANGKETQA